MFYPTSEKQKFVELSGGQKYPEDLQVIYLDEVKCGISLHRES